LRGPLSAYSRMARKANRTEIVLESGQLWQTNRGYIQIIQLGKTLAHYRQSTRVDQRGIPVLIASMKTMVQMLQAGKAQLIEPSS
jgi:hypothetical protein